MTPKGSGPGRRAASRRAGVDPLDGLLDEFGRGMLSGGPLDAEMFASMVTSCWQSDLCQPGDAMAMAIPMIEGLEATGRTEALILLAGLAAVGPDLAAARARRATQRLADDQAVVPVWLADLGRARVEECWRVGHVLGDGESYLLGCRYPSGAEHTVMVYVDHNLGTLVKDAFPAEGSLAENLGHFRRVSADDPDTVIERVDLAQAAAHIGEALELTDITVPPIETDTYPAVRPLLDARLATMPAGGAVASEPEWPEAVRGSLIDEFFDSPEGGRWAGDDDAADVVFHIVWFGAEYNVGGPLRWSGVVVEVFLADWFPRKVVAAPAVVGKVVPVLGDWVRFVGRRRGLRPALVDETLTAVGEFAPDLHRLVDDPRSWGPAKTFVARMVSDGVDLGDEDAVACHVDAANARAAGGSRAGGAETPAASSVVEAAPFSWTGVPEGLRRRVAEILAVCDRVTADVLDAEYTDLARRLVAKLARKRPSPLGRGNTTIWAGGVLYALGQHNWLFYRSAPMHLPGKELARALGISQASISQKATMVKAAAGLGPHDTEFRRAEINARGPFASLYRYGL